MDFTDEQIAILKKVSLHFEEYGDIALLPIVAIKEIENHQLALEDLERYGILRALEVKNKDDLGCQMKNAESIFGEQHLNNFLQEGGGYMVALMHDYQGPSNYISEQIHTHDRLKRSRGVWYELMYDDYGANPKLVLLDHYHGLKLTLHNITDGSTLQKILKELFNRPNHRVASKDVIKHHMKKDLYQNIFTVEAFKKDETLRKMFFPVLSNKLLELRPKINRKDAESLDIDIIKLSDKLTRINRRRQESSQDTFRRLRKDYKTYLLDNKNTKKI